MTRNVKLNLNKFKSSREEVRHISIQNWLIKDFQIIYINGYRKLYIFEQSNATFVLHGSTTLYQNNMIDHYLFHYRFKKEKNSENLLNL